jgi:penicillin G amidase
MIRRLVACALLVLPVLSTAWAQSSVSMQAAGGVSLPGLSAPAQLMRDRDGLTHIVARNEGDLWFMQGWVHARDRLFQMDEFRRTASGTLAELLGPAALPSDVQFRTLGLRRAAERSMAALSPSGRAALQSYANGVNAYVTASALPVQYAALEITHIPPWTPVDSLAIGKLFAASLSLEIDTDSTVALASYRQAGAALGFDGKALFFDDLDRAAPFDTASTLPDAMQGRIHRNTAGWNARSSEGGIGVHAAAIALARRWGDQLRKVPALEGVMQPHKRAGSNLWAVSGRLSATGRPMIANDKHLQLSTPAIWYPVGLEVPGRIEVFGDSFAGVPAVLDGVGRHIAWGSTNTLFDVTDTYQEQLVPDSQSPSGLSSVYKGRLEPVIPIPEVFRANQVGDGVPDNVAIVPAGGAIPAFTLIVPRRNNGPIVQFDAATGVALSLQWVGFSGTREIEAVLGFARARSMDDFVAALQNFDVGSQNWVVADARGNIGYFTSGEVPVREDLQAGFVDGLPPNFIRNGQGGNEWLPVTHPQPQQALGFEILPFAELPQIVNPPAGFFVNANNDPLGVTHDNNPFNTLRTGGGIYYLSYTFDDPTALRAGQITDRLLAIAARRHVTFEDMQSIQADVVLRDAKVFVPYINHAFERARRPGARPELVALATDPGVVEAVGRLKNWNFSSPSGLVQGWDAGKPAGTPPSAASIDASVAATIYNLWRSRFIANTIDKVVGGVGLPVPDATHVMSALRNLLEGFAQRGGRGASGIDFFPLPAVPAAEDRRDIVILQSVSDALALLASDEFKPAFGNSTHQADYRWGKLHRIVFANDLGGPFSIPPAGGAFPAPLAGLDGIPTDGGFDTVDAGSFDPRAYRLDDFMFAHGPSQRLVVEMAPGATGRAENIWPGGTSGVLGSPLYFQFLTRWLANDAIALHLGAEQGHRNEAVVERFNP